MFIIPGFLISAITFPGVMMHEFGHQLACRICKVPVFKVQYFKMTSKNIGFSLQGNGENAIGYVEHERTDNPWKSLLITYGPFIFNTLVGIFFTAPLALMWALNYSRNVVPFWATLLCYLLAYIGISCLANAFPSSGDAQSLFSSVVKNKKIPLIFRILITPFVVVIFICSVLKIFWFDFIYAFGVPELLYAIITHNPPHFWSMF